MNNIMNYLFGLLTGIWSTVCFSCTALLMGAFLLVFLTLPARAQMFSVGDDDPGRTDIPATAIYAGLEPVEFMYTGPQTFPEGGVPGRFEFSGTALRLRLETPGVNISFGTGGSLTGIDGISFVDVSLQTGYDLTLLRSRKLVVQVPLNVKSGVTSVVSDQTFVNSTQFNQGSLIGGVGGYIAFRPEGNLRFQGGFVPYYGFSFATGGTFGGSLGSLEGQLRIFLDRIFGNIGITAGYDYNFDRYNIEQDEFDYDLRSHSIIVGITF